MNITRSTTNQSSLFEMFIAIQYINQTQNKKTHSHSKFSSPNLSKDYCGHKKHKKKLLWNSRFSFEDAPILLCILMGCVSTLQRIQIDSRFPLIKNQIDIGMKRYKWWGPSFLIFCSTLTSPQHKPEIYFGI